mmetsp:Transcript_55174/g.118445  ORF Transcript_55174/g.118445 Transcript_55174/m.118445 type:complete len:412 (+) Transcript_55174:643-1878(+)
MPRHDLPPGPVLLGLAQRLLQPGQVGALRGLHAGHAHILVAADAVRVGTARAAEFLEAYPVVVVPTAVIGVHVSHKNVYHEPIRLDALVVVLVWHGPGTVGVHLGVPLLEVPVSQAPGTTVVMVAKNPKKRHAQLALRVVLVLEVHIYEGGVQGIIRVHVSGDTPLQIQGRGNASVVKIVPHVNHSHQIILLGAAGHGVRHPLLGIVRVFVHLGIRASIRHSLEIRKHGVTAGLRAARGSAVAQRRGAPVTQGIQAEGIIGLQLLQWGRQGHRAGLPLRGVKEPHAGQAVPGHASNNILVDTHQVSTAILTVEITHYLLQSIIALAVFASVHVFVQPALTGIPGWATGEHLVASNRPISLAHRSRGRRSRSRGGRGGRRGRCCGGRRRRRRVLIRPAALFLRRRAGRSGAR